MKFFFILAIFLVFHAALGDVDLQNLEIPNLDLDDFPTIKEKCDQAGGPGTYDKFKAAKDSFQTCVTGFVNVTVMKDEVEEAKKTGSMDEVFGKYCGKRPKLETCVDDLTKSLRPCLDEEGKTALNITMNVLKQLGDFLCYRDGDRIAMFVAEGGVECIQSRTEGIKNCVNSTFTIQPATMNTNSLPSLLMDKNKCDALGRLQTCVVEELEKCDESTPANIIDALFKFIKRSACTDKNKRSLQMHTAIKRSAVILADEGFINPYVKLFKRKCAENAPDGGYEALTSAFKSVCICIKDAEGLNTSMAVWKEDVVGCIKTALEETEACLPEPEKFWPELYVETIRNFLHFMSDKEIIKNLLNFVIDSENGFDHLSQTKVNDCFRHLNLLSDAKKEVWKCLDASENGVFIKQTVCLKLWHTSTRLIRLVRKFCHRSVTDKIDGLQMPLIDPLVKTCDEKDYFR